METKKMNKAKIVKKPALAMKHRGVYIRITKGMSGWLSKNNYSPTGIFMEACKDLGYKGE